MTAVYVCSDDERAGKTAFVLALGRCLQRDGVSIGYWKPVSPTGPADPDAAFAKHALGLADEPVNVAPVPFSETADQATFDWAGRLLPAFLPTVANRTTLLIEGCRELAPARPVLDFLGGQETRIGSTKAIFVARYRGAGLADRVMAARQVLGNALAGVVINAVPDAHRWLIDAQVLPVLSEGGVPVFGVLPQDRAMTTLTPRELAVALEAEVLVNADKPAMDELFDAVMFGAMSAEDGKRYFDRKQNKLVVTRGDRPDVHMAALSTSTHCLLLTGGYPSYPFVLDRAETLGVPMLSVGADLQGTIDRLDEVLVASSARSVAKIERFGSLLDTHLRLPALYDALGIKLKD